MDAHSFVRWLGSITIFRNRRKASSWHFWLIMLRTKISDASNISTLGLKSCRSIPILVNSSLEIRSSISIMFTCVHREWWGTLNNIWPMAMHIILRSNQRPTKLNRGSRFPIPNLFTPKCYLWCVKSLFMVFYMYFIQNTSLWSKLYPTEQCAMLC